MTVDAILVYDGDCRVCRLGKSLVRALDLRRRVRPVALRDPESEQVLAGMDEDDRWDSFHLVRDGHATSRGDGVIEIIGVLPLGGGIPRLAAEVPVLRGAASHLYDLVHSVRDRLECGVTPRRDRGGSSGSV